MSEIAIRCEGVGKRYRLGQRERYRALRDTLTDMMTAPFRIIRSAFQKSANGNGKLDNMLWALRDVSFVVRPGEVVGIIGRNGAGKSTLLKILSRITKPSEGMVEIHGRVGSLLEVGTGFHPELTGRENIYLNGSILGMRKAEIDRKFDEIVRFAEVEEFIDTPVKRYSSGMYVRLAFAVAAHLEPEILVIDEVLAVGDAQFQKKCLGKMGDVAKEGRTVLFVSHNMQAVQSLCHRAILIEAGRVVAEGSAKEVVSRYLASISEMGSEINWPENEAPGNDEIRLTSLRVSTENSNGGVYSSSEDLNVEMEFTARMRHSALCVGFDVVNSEGVVIARSYQTDLPPENWPELQFGKNRWQCTIPRGLLNAGLYYLCPKIGLHNMYWIVNLDTTVRFEVILDHGVSPFWNTLNSSTRPGVIAPIFNWVS
ncbi:MAG TPA: polysaccharide ABC transporter ATP-binding protein [Pyrinomonadaceae bacterium]|jgi:lipopolysaccharide transport system ATP-binding protein